MDTRLSAPLYDGNRFELQSQRPLTQQDIEHIQALLDLCKKSAEPRQHGSA